MKGRNRKQDRPNSKGRNAGRLGSDGAVIILRRSFWLSPQISALSVTAKALVVELTAMYKGPERSAEIYLSVRDAAKRLGLRCLKASSLAIDELVAIGLLTETMPSSFATKGGIASRARAFRLNWKARSGSAVGGTDLAPLNFQQLDDKQKRRIADRSTVLDAFERRKSPVGDSSTLAAFRAEIAQRRMAENATLTEGSPKMPSVAENTTHIYYHGDRGPGWSHVPFVGPVSQRISLSQIIGPSLTACRDGLMVRSPEGQAPLFCRLVSLRRLLRERSTTA